MTFFIYSVLNLTDLLVLISHLIAENIVIRQEYKSSIIQYLLTELIKTEKQRKASPLLCARGH